MEKHFIIPQPPIADHFTLLVDHLNKTATFGHVTEIEKCQYNRQLIDTMGLDINFLIQVQTAFSKIGITTVVPIGRYIAIIKATKNETSQEMYFFDSFVDMEFREQNDKILGGYFSKNIVQEFEKVHSKLMYTWSDEFDKVELSLVNDNFS